ncbi:MAG: hypothetical protein AB7O66_22055 [Limisphaerales bacterium]
MRWNTLTGLAVALLAFAVGESRVVSHDAVLVRHHFAGLSGVAEHPDLAPLKAILSLPESKRLLGEVDSKLAASLPIGFGVDGAKAAPHIDAFLPWVRLALERESRVEVHGSKSWVGSWAVAVRMEEAEAVKVGGDLRGVLAPLLGEGDSGGGEEGRPDWELDGPEDGRRPAARFALVSGWAILGSGVGAFNEVRGRLSGPRASEGGLTGAVSRLEVDLANLAPLLGWGADPVAPVDRWPAVRMTVEPRKGRIRTSAELTFPEPLGLTLAPWVLPKEVLRDPMVGFTAIQGADRWLGKMEWFKPYNVNEWPNPIYLWSVAGDPWNQYLAGPMNSPTNLMAQVSGPIPMRMVTNMSWRGQVFGLRITNKATRVEFRGLPYLLPFLQSIREGDSSLLYGGLFPQPPKTDPAPVGLLQQVAGRTNLVFYDWETTGGTLLVTNPPGTPGPRISTNPVGRLAQFKQLSQFWRLMMNTNSSMVPLARNGEIWVPGWEWINAAQGRLGDTITEVTQTGPSRLSLVRSSQIGFNALELAYLLRWAENPGFPGWTGDEPPSREVKAVPTPGLPSKVGKP